MEEIKKITETADALQLETGGILSISKEKIKEWYNQYCKEETPQVQPEPSAGDPDYIVGVISDSHFDVEDSHNSEYQQDLQNALRYYEKAGVSMINSVGDICQYKDLDLEAFKSAYDSKLPFYTVMGNHDYLRIYDYRDAAHQVPAKYSSAEDMWQKNVLSLAKGADIHYLSDSQKERSNFWFEKNGDLYIFISIDYGASNARYEVIRAINQLDYSDANVQLMTQYVADTDYNRSKESIFDYQFYSPTALIWLKNILEANPKKRKFLHMHHFMPNGAGDTFELYRELRVWPLPASEAIRDKSYSGSNTICGLTFWYIDKLLREHTNVICFGGHSHYRAKAQEDVIRRAYHVILPTGNETTPLVDNTSSLKGTQYDYKVYRTTGHSYADIAPTVHVPSLAKPCNMEGSSLYGASEGILMEVYKDKVILKYVCFKEEGSSMYSNNVVKAVTLDIPNDSSKTVEPSQPEKPAETTNGITIRLHNNTGQDVRFSGKFQMYIQESDTELDLHFSAPTNTSDGWPHWESNPYILKAGDTKEFKITELNHYYGDGSKVTHVQESLNGYYNKHFRTADTAEWPNGIPAVKLGVYAMDRAKDKGSTGPAMIHVRPLPSNNCQIKKGGVYDLYLDKIKDNATLDKSWLNKIYSASDKYKYVIM